MSDDSASGDPGTEDSETANSGDEDADPTDWWDEVYEKVDRLPWDIEGSQPAFVELAEAGELRERVLDVGCGTGTHALYAAERGHSAMGVDVSERAIERARARAASAT